MRSVEFHFCYTTDVTTRKRRSTAAQPSSCLQVCQISVSGKSCPDYHDFGTHYYIPDHWHFLLLHKADLGDLGTISSPAWMGWRGAKQSFHFPYSLIFAMHLPHWYLQRRRYFLQILKLLAGYFQRSMFNFTKNDTVLSQETLSLGLDAYVWLLYFLTAWFHRSFSLLETHHVKGLITQSLKWCIPYTYIASSSTLILSSLFLWEKNQGFHYCQAFCKGHLTWTFSYPWL